MNPVHPAAKLCSAAQLLEQCNRPSAPLLTCQGSHLSGSSLPLSQNPALEPVCSSKPWPTLRRDILVNSPVPHKQPPDQHEGRLSSAISMTSQP